MTFRIRQTTGLFLLVLGFLLLLLNALDYVLGWNQIGPVFIVIGVALLVTGAGLAKRARGNAAVSGENQGGMGNRGEERG